MTRPTLLYGGHKALEYLEWISKHSTTRVPDLASRKHLEECVVEIERYLLRVISAQEH